MKRNFDSSKTPSYQNQDPSSLVLPSGKRVLAYIIRNKFVLVSSGAMGFGLMS